MSHITSIDLEILDIDALKAALTRVCPDLEFREGQKTFKWFGQFVGDSPIPDGLKVEDYGKCDHAIGFRAGSRTPAGESIYGPLPSYRAAFAYEVGLVQLPGHKGYRLVYDNFVGGYGLENAIGAGAGKLRQAYAREVSIKAMRRQGYRVREETTTDGTIKLHCTKPSGR